MCWGELHEGRLDGWQARQDTAGRGWRMGRRMVPPSSDAGCVAGAHPRPLPRSAAHPSRPATLAHLPCLARSPCLVVTCALK